MPKPRSSSGSVAPTFVAVLTLLLVCAIAIIVGLLARPSGGLSVPKGDHVLRVTEHDFAVQPSTVTLHPGTYVVVDHNQGPSAHELVMWKTERQGEALPLHTTGEVNEDSSALDSVLDSGRSLQPNETRLLSVTLDPGHYVMVCNLPGHYHAGMHVDINVQ